MYSYNDLADLYLKLATAYKELNLLKEQKIEAVNLLEEQNKVLKQQVELYKIQINSYQKEIEELQEEKADLNYELEQRSVELTECENSLETYLDNGTIHD